MVQALEADPDNPRLIEEAHQLRTIAQEQLGAFYWVTTPTGSTVTFYMGPCGSGGVSEFGFLDQPMTVSAGSSYADMFRKIRPDLPVPEELLQADEEVRTAGQNCDVKEGASESENGSPIAAPDEQLMPKHATSDCGHFISSHNGCPPANDGDGSWCACNLTGDLPGDGTLYGSSGPDHTHFANRIGVYDGTISLYIQMPEYVQSWGWAVLQGELHFWHFWSAWVDGQYQRTYFQTRVTQASGDGYHWGACFDKERSAAGWDCPT